jgi:uncharacterized pyridoxamine 5'-phosphate oxidase family protein
MEVVAMDLQVRDVLESKTVFETKDGKIVETSAFPFWRLAFNVKHELSDKTWRYAAGWSEEYPLKFAQIRVEKDLEKDEFANGREFQEFVEKLTNGTFYDMSFTWAGSEWLKGYFRMEEPFKMEVWSFWIKGVLIGLRFIRWGNSTYASNIKKFTIETPSGVLFEKERPMLQVLPYPHDDWHIIHRVSQKNLVRRARLEMAHEYGNAVGFHTAGLASRLLMDKGVLGVVLPLRPFDFKPSEKGGFIVRGYGKYIITDSNKLGYYLITKELEKVKFAKLVKEIDDVEEEIRAWEKIKAEREEELKEKLLKGVAYVVSVSYVMDNKKLTRFYYLERENGKLVLRVPKWLAGHVIGKDGQRIKRLQEFLGEKVHIETYDDVVPEKVKLSFGW